MNLKSSLVTYETKVDTFPAVLPFYDTQYRVPYVPQMIAAIIGHDLKFESKIENRKLALSSQDKPKIICCRLNFRVSTDHRSYNRTRASHVYSDTSLFKQSTYLSDTAATA
jgi:hypothetical protein